MLVQIGWAILIVGGVFGLIFSGKKVKDLYDLLRDKVIDFVGGEEQLDKYKKVALEVVLAVEQISKTEELTNEQKKELALKLAPEFIELAGLGQVSTDTIGWIIEAELFLFNLLKKKKTKEDAIEEDLILKN